MCESVVLVPFPFWLFSSRLNPLSNGDGASLCTPHRGTVRSDEFAQGRVGNGLMGKSEKKISPHLKQHIWYSVFPGTGVGFRD